jgi:acetyltransferase-like isoleucine patch superfamily enzyme
VRALFSLAKGWIYLLAFISGGNFLRLARLKKLGKRVKVSPTAFFKFPEQIEIGDDAFINHLCCIWAAPQGPIRIGSNVLLGPGVSILASNHGTSASSLIRLQPGEDQPVSIGNDVWLGANVVVTAGVDIGDGCVVGAGSVVTRSLPAYSICAGIPAKPIRRREYQ